MQQSCAPIFPRTDDGAVGNAMATRAMATRSHGASVGIGCR
jgi:hypothetical protein